MTIVERDIICIMQITSARIKLSHRMKEFVQFGNVISTHFLEFGEEILLLFL